MPCASNTWPFGEPLDHLIKDGTQEHAVRVGECWLSIHGMKQTHSKNMSKHTDTIREANVSSITATRPTAMSDVSVCGSPL